MSISKLPALVAALALSLCAGWANAGTVRLNAGVSGDVTQRAFQGLIDDFHKAHPGIRVQASYIDVEDYRSQLPNWLAAQAPDLITWSAGERLSYYVRRGLIDDISDLWQKNSWAQPFAASASAVQVDGRFYGLPYMTYSWGLHYRKDLFARAGIASEPKTWPQFLQACRQLRSIGVAPVIAGGKDNWNISIWFEYLNLRINGHDFNMALTAGQVPYTDPRIRRVFETWKAAMDAGCFADNLNSYDYSSAQVPLYNGKAAMVLMGTFITAGFPAAVKDKMGYMQFPKVDPSIPFAENAPTDTFNIPARAANKADARVFLTFAARPENQAKFVRALATLAPHAGAAAPADATGQTSLAILGSAQGRLSQIYDRDTIKEMAEIGMRGMQEFVAKPERIDTILVRLERERKRIYRQP